VAVRTFPAELSWSANAVTVSSSGASRIATMSCGPRHQQICCSSAPRLFAKSAAAPARSVWRAGLGFDPEQKPPRRAPQGARRGGVSAAVTVAVPRNRPLSPRPGRSGVGAGAGRAGRGGRGDHVRVPSGRVPGDGPRVCRGATSEISCPRIDVPIALGWGGGCASGHWWPPSGPPGFTEGPSSLLASVATGLPTAVCSKGSG